MCGIVGILGREPVAGLMVDALKRLEYRGYDSAGVATLEEGHLTRRRAEGKLRNLEQRLNKEPLSGTIGIGHTRWATHGRAKRKQCPPPRRGTRSSRTQRHHREFRELRRELEQGGANLRPRPTRKSSRIWSARKCSKGRSPADAVAAALPRLKGAFALAFLFDGEEDLLIGARRGSPLAIGYGDGEMFLGSDAIALAPFTDAISYLEEGDWVECVAARAEIHDVAGATVKRPVLKSHASSFLVDKGNHRHFMAKEIHEQPEVVGHTLSHYVDMAAGQSCSAARCRSTGAS